MKAEEQRLFAVQLLDLVQKMEQMIKDYCRLLTAKDDGHGLEQEESEEDPF